MAGLVLDTPAKHIYTGDGTTRVYPIPTYIQGDDWIRIEIDGVYIVDRRSYDIVNNSIIFVTAPGLNTQVSVQVATSVEALSQLGNSTNVDIVAGSIGNVNAVATNINNVNTTAGSIGNVNAVADNISKINTVATNIVDINQIVDNLPEILLADDNATTATQQATIATTKASEASASANQALTSRNQAETFKNSASTSATTATTKASEALASATSASTSATSASTSATSASTSATSASTSASQALTSRNQAETFAQQAKASAKLVNSIAELKLISGSADDKLEVFGYYEKGDGGGGLFYWDSTSTETDNGGTIIQATGITTGRWKRVFDGAVNVKWFGANTTRSDNQVAIQLAIDSFPNGGSVIIPNCELKINGTIYLKDNISLIGEERDIGYLNSFSYKSKLLAVAIFDKMIDVTGAHISISNIGIDGAKLCNYGLITEGPFGRIGGASYTKLSITGFNKTGIRLQNGGLSKIYNCQVSDCLEVGIDMEGWGDAEISGCYINTINMDSSSTVNAPSTATVYGVGIRIRKSALGQAGNFNIHGGKIEFCRVGILINAGQGINITGVNFDTNRKASILLQSDTTPLPLAKTLYDNTVTTSIMINGNRFLGGLQGTQSTTAHIISNYSRFVTITGNGFKKANDAAGDFFGSPVVGPDYGIWLYNSEECNITGNDLEASALTHCLVIQNVAINAARNRISGNSLDGSELIDNGTILEENAIGGLLVSAPNGAIYNTSTKAYIENDGTKNSTLSVYTKAPPSSGGVFQFGTTSAASSADFFMIGQSGNGTTVTTNNLFIKTNGNIENTNNSYGGLSDARLKEKIKDATNKLDDIMKVKIRNFHFIGNDEKQIGVIAQEIEEIFPGLVTTNIIDDVEIKSVKYSVLVPIMLKALQELVLKVEKLENSINIK